MLIWPTEVSSSPILTEYPVWNIFQTTTLVMTLMSNGIPIKMRWKVSKRC